MLQVNMDMGVLEVQSAVAPAAHRRLQKKTLVRSRQRALGLLLPAALLALWTLSSLRGWVAPQILPSPMRVARTLAEQLSSGQLFENLGISLARVAGGFVIGSALGVAAGVAMGLSRRAEQYAYPLFKALSQVPVLGLLPLAMMVLGIGESLKLAIIAQATWVPVALNVREGIRNVPGNYLEVARVFQFSRRQLLRRVVLPATVPALFVGLRGGLTQAWLALVTVELLASSEGLGFMIVWGRQLFQLDLVLSAILTVGLVGLALDRLLELTERKLLSWRPEVSFGAAGAR